MKEVVNMTLYLVFLGVGVGFVILSFIFGEFADFECGSAFQFFRPNLIAVFLIVTGGLGFLLHGGAIYAMGAIILFAFCASCGVAMAALLHRMVIIPLQKAQNTSTFNMHDTVGIEAEVISPIPQGGYGKIKYNVSGSVVTSPAKSEDGNPIKNGEAVEIIYVEGNTYFVRAERVTAVEPVPTPN